MRVKTKLLCVAILLHMFTYFGSRILASGMYHFDMTTPIDRRIGLVPWTIVIYLGCYIFWGTNYYLGYMQEDREAEVFILSEIIAKLICLFFYLVIPTTCVRPVVTEPGVFESAVRWIYKVDAADNLFPSIHCLTSWLCVVAVRNQERIPAWYKKVSVFLAVLICVSTLTTKQHVIVDVAAGVLCAEVSFRIARKKVLTRK